MSLWCPLTVKTLITLNCRMSLCHSELLERSQSNECCCSYSWGGRHAEKHCDHSVTHSINFIKNPTAWLAGRRSRHQFANGANHTVTTRGVWVISASGSDINHKVNTVASLREFCVVYSQKISAYMSPHERIDTEVTQRDFVCCASHSTEHLTTCMIPHYPLSAVSQLPHCPLLCHFWLS